MNFWLMKNTKKTFFILGFHYIFYKTLSKSLLQLTEIQQDPVCDDLAAKLSLYTCYYFIALERENHFRVNFFLSEYSFFLSFHLDILIWKFSVTGQSFIAIPRSILELLRKYFYFKIQSFGEKV